MKQPAAEALVAKWQQAFGLTRWHIEVEVVTGEELRERFAEVSYNRTSLNAMVRILSPKEHHARQTLDNSDPYQLYEQSVIHEMLHLLFADHTHPDGTPQSEAEHDSIMVLARALASLT